MPCRLTVAYEAVFQHLRGEGLEVTTAHVDFEVALRNAIIAVWGRQVHIVGCIAHYATCIYRWLNTHHMTALVRDNHNALHVVRLVTGEDAFFVHFVAICCHRDLLKSGELFKE